MSLQQDLGELERKVAEQDARLRVFETYAKAAVVIALIFGIGGAWGATAVSKAKDTIIELNDRLDTLDKKTAHIDDHVNTSTQTILKAKDAALADLRSQVPAVLQEAKALRRCRVCYQVVGSDGGDQGGQCGGERAGCSAWSDAPNWSSAYNDDSDNRSGWCAMRWRLECE